MERIKGAGSLKRYFNSEYIGAYSIDPGCEPILTIDSLWFGEIVLDKGRKEAHVVIRFKEKSVAGCAEVKPLILNSTNRKALKKAYGTDSADVLEGKPIQLYIDPKVRDPQDGGFTEGIRIRPFKPRTAPQTVIKCEECGNTILDYKGRSAANIAAKAKAKYGKQLCAVCAIKAGEETKNEADE